VARIASSTDRGTAVDAPVGSPVAAPAGEPFDEPFVEPADAFVEGVVGR
jgi:hypothetical protein